MSGTVPGPDGTRNLRKGVVHMQQARAGLP